MSSHTPRRPLPFVLSSHTRASARAFSQQSSRFRGCVRTGIYRFSPEGTAELSPYLASVGEKGIDFSGRREGRLGAGAGDRNCCGRRGVSCSFGGLLSAGEGNGKSRVKAVTGSGGVHSVHGECGNLLRRTIAASEKDALRTQLEGNIPHPHRQQFFGSSGGIDLNPAQ